MWKSRHLNKLKNIKDKNAYGIEIKIPRSSCFAMKIPWYKKMFKSLGTHALLAHNAAVIF